MPKARTGAVGAGIGSWPLISQPEELAFVLMFFFLGELVARLCYLAFVGRPIAGQIRGSRDEPPEVLGSPHAARELPS